MAGTAAIGMAAPLPLAVTLSGEGCKADPWDPSDPPPKLAVLGAWKPLAIVGTTADNLTAGVYRAVGKVLSGETTMENLAGWSGALDLSLYSYLLFLCLFRRDALQLRAV